MAASAPTERGRLTSAHTMGLRNLLAFDLELTPGLQCPRCHEFKVRGHSTGRSVSIVVSISIVSILVTLLLQRRPPRPATDALLTFSALVAFVGTLWTAGTLISAFLGRNRCMSCEHCWR